MKQKYPKNEGQDNEYNNELFKLKSRLPIKKQMICECAGFGKKDKRVGSHLKKQGNPDVISTLTCLCGMNKVVVEVEEK